ncbi:MAG: sigma-54 dependent transcriptional regulator [Reinekea forsetii]|jgi:two-component system C4-dicarboxylate transport response regulator DctD|uniref:Two-component system response regulator, Fis family n=1 Tax=Reinekea forsetii TaxID=1336806 RepID=A0A2K8KY82_9GAMM|nr:MULTISPECIES: sigma-54 dependent transcriptional regulator [Reinekea]ATX77466.1 two-component system response regulator, Fis family [Reinekea forsetii]MDO7645656.1 sigma-54 dependent transcriptional regulator [Reinekea forsetii]MDO7674011.1 sigma-54 dependent transcriptional regulator [Reinekea forsetii]
MTDSLTELQLSATIWLIDDDDDLLHALQQGLELDGFTVESNLSATEVLNRLSSDAYGVVISDILMPDMNGMDLLQKVMDIDVALPTILMTGHGDVPLAVEAIRKGAYDFLEKPFSMQQLSQVLKRALEKRRLVLENRSLRETIDDHDPISQRLVGRSEGIVYLREQINALSDTNVDCLIIGETGSGKEVVARAIHDFSNRKHQPFVAINCAAVPIDLIESELFGHEAGAFTGATKKRIGKLEYAQGGTVFLDEIDSMPMDLQAKILRAIEQRTIEPLGSNKTIALDITIIAATKEDLETLSSDHRFRLDLYYRLNVITFKIPPLRDRREDIALLFFHLARIARSKYRREIPTLSPALVEQLTHYAWPGNVRELRNYADRFVLGMWNGFVQETTTSSHVGDLASRLSSFEKTVIEQELMRHGGSLKLTYTALGLSRKGLYDKIKRLKIQIKDLADDELDG